MTQGRIHLFLFLSRKIYTLYYTLPFQKLGHILTIGNNSEIEKFEKLPSCFQSPRNGQNQPTQIGEDPYFDSRRQTPRMMVKSKAPKGRHSGLNQSLSRP